MKAKKGGGAIPTDNICIPDLSWSLPFQVRS